MTVSRGDACRERRDWRGAIENYKAALTVDRDDARAHAGLAFALLALRRITGANAEAELALLHAPGGALGIAQHALAAVRLAQGRLDDAWLHCELAILNAPLDPDARLLGAAIQTRLGDLGSARRLLDQALKIERSSSVYAALAQHGVRTGELEDAAQWADTAVELAPDDPDARQAAALVALERGNLYDADRHGRAAVVASPSVEMLKLWARIQRRQNRAAGALWTLAVFTYAYGRDNQLTWSIATFIAVRVAIVVVHAFDLDEIGLYLWLGWLAWCVFTWVAPPMAFRWIEARLRVAPREGN